jgi:signal transduction histidine kinase
MKSARSRLVARTLVGVTLLATVAAVTLRVFAGTHTADPVDLIILLVIAVFGAIGALIVTRRPENSIGWLFLAVAVGLSLDALLIGLAGLRTFSSTAVARVGAWLEGWTWLPAVFVPTVFPLLLFPDGRLPSRRWRPVVWIGAAGLIAFSFSMAFTPSNYEGGVPIGLRFPTWLVEVASVGAIPLVGALIGGLVATVRRFRRSRGEQRQQLRWLAYAGVLGASSLAGSFIVGGVLSALGVNVEEGPVTDVLNLLVLMSMLAIPVAMTVAILKYRLYDIDLVIRKTVVYVVLAGLIFVGGGLIARLATGLLVGGRGEDSLLIAGILIGLLVWPLRRLATRIADRLVYRGRSSPYEILTEFSGRMAGAYATEDVLPRLARVLAEGTGARVAVVWLEVGAAIRAEAIWPPDAAAPVDPPPDAVPVAHQGERLGALSVEMPANDPMSPRKTRIVRDLAAQAGLILRNVRLIEDLRESRRRIVAAQDERAKKLERDIHDGAQQQLVALQVKQRLVDSMIERQPARAHELMEQLQRDTASALEDLRDLARGIYPPLLADQGLGAALESQARKSAIPVRVEVEGLGRYPQETEAAVYFSALEALQNVGKYAEASQATVRLAQANGTLRFEVADDGRGFDPEAVEPGTGLQGMADRLSALGGELTVRSAPGEGTTVSGRLPGDPSEPDP